MPDHRFRISHSSIVRLIAVANLAQLGAMAFLPYFHLVYGGWLGKAIFSWFLSSSFLLPMFVVFEALWMRRCAESRSVWIDAIFAIVWFLIFWGTVVYGFTHYSPI